MKIIFWKFVLIILVKESVGKNPPLDNWDAQWEFLSANLFFPFSQSSEFFAELANLHKRS